MNWTTELLSKPEPLTVNVKAGSPAVLPGGDKLAIAGTGWFTVKLSAGVEVPPPGVGLVTVTETVPGVVISDAAICVVNCVEFINEVAG